MVSSNQNESLLIAKIAQGNEYAFEITFLKYYNKLCKYTWKYVRNKNVAEEIVQDMFADIWENREQLDTDGNLRGLLFVAAKNKALDHIKHKKVTEKYTPEIKRRKEEIISSDSYIQKSLKNALLHRDIYKAIDDLPPKARRIFLLNRKEGLTYKEIANYLSISVKTVESQISRVLSILRSRLAHLALLILFFINYLILEAFDIYV